MDGGRSMRAVKATSATPPRIDQATREGCRGLTWKEKRHRKFLMCVRYIGLTFPFGCESGDRMGWKAYWKATEPVVRPVFPHANGRNWSTSLTVVPWPMDSLPASEHVRWCAALFSFAEYPVAWPTPPPFIALRSSPEGYEGREAAAKAGLRGSLLRRSFPSPTIPPMFPRFSMDLSFRSSVPERHWLGPTQLSNLIGSAIDSQTLKKTANSEGAAILFGDEASFRQDPTLYQT